MVWGFEVSDAILAGLGIRDESMGAGGLAFEDVRGSEYGVRSCEGSDMLGFS